MGFRKEHRNRGLWDTVFKDDQNNLYPQTLPPTHLPIIHITGTGSGGAHLPECESWPHHLQLCDLGQIMNFSVPLVPFLKRKEKENNCTYLPK